jgi:hypothetical protein
MFMTPPAAPLRGPAIRIMVAQKRPSTLSTRAVETARQTAAR